MKYLFFTFISAMIITSCGTTQSNEVITDVDSISVANPVFETDMTTEIDTTGYNTVDYNAAAEDVMPAAK